MAKLLSLALFVSAETGCLASGLQPFIDSPERSAANRARDIYRHPLEVLTFFGVRNNATVVEIWPAPDGYWTEILAPYLKDHGHYIAAWFEDTPSHHRANEVFAAKLEAAPALFGKIEIKVFAGERHEIAPPESADFVLTFRNLHNWMADGEEAQAFRTFYHALKPGGILGLVEHRAPADQPQDPLAKSGYVRQDVAIEFAKDAGFQFLGSSEADANPKDTKDYSAGVWALPPVFRLKDQDHDKYAEIGESDRFVLKFMKPAR